MTANVILVEFPLHQFFFFVVFNNARFLCRSMLLAPFFAWCDPPIYHCWRERKLKNDNTAEKKKKTRMTVYLCFSWVIYHVAMLGPNLDVWVEDYNWYFGMWSRCNVMAWKNLFLSSNVTKFILECSSNLMEWAVMLM